ncbi:M23 family metallopeptidase [Shewanella baltica]|uniref:M23 family metallopeptidase n=1 Tax=Shewanella baltica TaxID=62322 RepID=UPI0024BB60E4|nr:M23 family metallopeptidase [Shewanella baltica]
MLIVRIKSLVILVSLAVGCTSSFAASSFRPTPAKDCILASPIQSSASIGASVKPPFPPVQLDISVPIEPTLFPSGDFNYLVYELHFQNYTDESLKLQELEIVDVSRTPSRAVAAFTGSQLYERLLPIGADKIDDEHPIDGGKRAVALICLAFDNAVTIPDKLGHRMLVGDSVAEGPIIGTRHTKLNTLAPPVMGKDWVAANGPSLHSHHRTGLFVAGGVAHLSRRFAIDWKQKDEQGEMYYGDARDVRSYYSYDEKVFAVADATVVSAQDGLPDNIPRTAAGFNTAVSLTMENVAGNAVILDIGDGQYAYYAHMKPGSIRVKAGEHVKRGDWLGQIGNSGDSRWPHLHFQVTTSPDILASEGLPFVIDHYRTRDDNGVWQSRTSEYPIGDIAVEFVLDSVTPLK